MIEEEDVGEMGITMVVVVMMKMAMVPVFLIFFFFFAQLPPLANFPSFPICSFLLVSCSSAPPSDPAPARICIPVTYH